MLLAAKEVGLAEDRIYVLKGDSEDEDGRKSLDDIIETARRKGIPRIPVRPATKDTLAYFILSSGTTGLPKGKRFDTIVIL